MEPFKHNKTESSSEAQQRIESRIREITNELQELTIERQKLKNEYDRYTAQYYQNKPDGIRKPTLKKLYF